MRRRSAARPRCGAAPGRPGPAEIRRVGRGRLEAVGQVARHPGACGCCERAQGLLAVGALCRTRKEIRGERRLPLEKRSTGCYRQRGPKGHSLGRCIKGRPSKALQGWSLEQNSHTHTHREREHTHILLGGACHFFPSRIHTTPCFRRHVSAVRLPRNWAHLHGRLLQDGVPRLAPLRPPAHPLRPRERARGGVRKIGRAGRGQSAFSEGAPVRGRRPAWDGARLQVGARADAVG
jgi:hypothetical protein